MFTYVFWTATLIGHGLEMLNRGDILALIVSAVVVVALSPILLGLNLIWSLVCALVVAWNDLGILLTGPIAGWSVVTQTNWIHGVWGYGSELSLYPTAYQVMAVACWILAGLAGVAMLIGIPTSMVSRA